MKWGALLRLFRRIYNQKKLVPQVAPPQVNTVLADRSKPGGVGSRVPGFDRLSVVTGTRKTETGHPRRTSRVLVDFKGYGMSMFPGLEPIYYRAGCLHGHPAHRQQHPATERLPIDWTLPREQKRKMPGNGSVTWSNVPVNGSLAGVSASQSIDWIR